MVRIEQTVLGRTVVLDRPRRRNALTLPMWQELGALVRSLDASGAEPVYVAGAGGYFCSGADLDTLRWAREDPRHADEFVAAVVGCLLALHTCRSEVVAVVTGGAAGGGVEILAACDRRVGIGSPSLVFPFGTHGMTLDDFTRSRLHALVGAEAAGRLVDGRHVVTAEEALRLGLLDERHDTLEAFAEAEATAPGRDGGGPGGGTSYLSGAETLDEAVRRAAAPMRRAFPPHPAS